MNMLLLVQLPVSRINFLRVSECSETNRTWGLSRDRHTFSVKGQTVNILTFVGAMLSVTTTLALEVQRSHRACK